MGSGSWPGSAPGQRAITDSPATVRSPGAATSSTWGGTKTSIREPNFISPMRSPLRTTSPGSTRVTTRRATRPTICRNTTRRTSPSTVSLSVISLRSFSVALSNR